MYVIASGSGFKASGNIQLFSAAGGTGTSIAQINSGDAQTFWTRHYIPPGVTSYITSMGMSLSSVAVVNGFIGATPNINSGIVGQQNIGMETVVTGYWGGNTGVVVEFPTPIPVPGPGRFYMQAVTSVTTGILYGSMTFYDLPTGALPGAANPVIPINPNFPPQDILT
jgi:hypothetical protein